MTRKQLKSKQSESPPVRLLKSPSEKIEPNQSDDIQQLIDEMTEGFSNISKILKKAKDDGIWVDIIDQFPCLIDPVVGKTSNIDTTLSPNIQAENISLESKENNRPKSLILPSNSPNSPSSTIEQQLPPSPPQPTTPKSPTNTNQPTSSVSITSNINPTTTLSNPKLLVKKTVYKSNQQQGKQVKISYRNTENSVSHAKHNPHSPSIEQTGNSLYTTAKPRKNSTSPKGSPHHHASIDISSPRRLPDNSSSVMNRSFSNQGFQQNNNKNTAGTKIGTTRTKTRTTGRKPYSTNYY